MFGYGLLKEIFFSTQFRLDDAKRTCFVEYFTKSIYTPVNIRDTSFGVYRSILLLIVNCKLLVVTKIHITASEERLDLFRYEAGDCFAVSAYDKVDFRY